MTKTRNSCNKFGNIVLGHRNGGLNSRSGLSFTANLNTVRHSDEIKIIPVS